MPSRPGEFHPEPLTDPDLTLSRQPARAIARRLPPSIEHRVPPGVGWTQHQLTRGIGACELPCQLERAVRAAWETYKSPNLCVRSSAGTESRAPSPRYLFP